MRFAKQLKRTLELVVDTLKPGYTGNDLLQAFKEFYPFEWNEIYERWKVYSEKDRFLKKNKGRTRYNPLKPEDYFFSLPKVKYILSQGFREKHKNNYNEEVRAKKERDLRCKRERQIKRNNNELLYIHKVCKMLMMKIEGEDLHEYECINLDDIKKS